MTLSLIHEEGEILAFSLIYTLTHSVFFTLCCLAVVIFILQEKSSATSIMQMVYPVDAEILLCACGFFFGAVH